MAVPEEIKLTEVSVSEVIGAGALTVAVFITGKDKEGAYTALRLDISINEAFFLAKKLKEEIVDQVRMLNDKVAVLTT